MVRCRWTIFEIKMATSEKLGVKAGSPLCVASGRLQQKKENVIEQLKCAEKFISELCCQRDTLISILDEECSSCESEMNVLKKILEDKRVALIKELQARRSQDLEATSASMELASVAIFKANKVADHSP